MLSKLKKLSLKNKMRPKSKHRRLCKSPNKSISRFKMPMLNFLKV